MSTQAKHLPAGFHTVTPYLFIRHAAKAIAFYKAAFGAKELLCLTMPDGKVAYAAIEIGDSIIMLADEFPNMGVQSPETLGGSPVTIHLYVDDVDALFKQALAVGAMVLKPIQDQFFGDRSGSLTDPFGHVWHIATHQEDVSNEEIQKRFQTMMQKS